MLKENVSERQMRRRRRANNELPLSVAKRLEIHMMRRNALIVLECSTALPFRYFRGIFYCSYCDAKCTDMDYLRQHVSNQHSNDPPTQRVFSKLRENNLIKIDVTYFSCRLCLGSLENLDELKQHISTCYGKELMVEYGDGVMPFKVSANDVTCHRCSAVFKSFPQADRHMNTHFQNHVCDECGKTFVTIPRLRKHVQSHEVGQFPCGECDEIFSTRVQRSCHKLRVHRDGLRYACPKCQQPFKTYYARANHLVEEHGQKNIEYHCSACDKTFATSSNRAAHYRLAHTHVERNYTCTDCGSSFITKSKLQRHAATHTKNMDHN